MPLASVSSWRSSITSVTPPRASASSDSTRSTIAGALKSGVAAGGSAPLLCTGGVTDRVEQGQPELLGVLLVALHLHDGEPARLARTAGPGAQQRRLPAAGRSRDDRHLPRRRAIQGSDKITPVDQPGSCWSHRQRPALVSTPDTSGAGHAVRAPSVSVPGQRACCQPRANPRFCCTLMHAPPRSRPVLRCPGAANHRDPVTTSHLAGGKPGPVAKARTAASDITREERGRSWLVQLSLRRMPGAAFSPGAMARGGAGRRQ